MQTSLSDGGIVIAVELVTRCRLPDGDMPGRACQQRNRMRAVLQPFTFDALIHVYDKAGYSPDEPTFSEASARSASSDRKAIP